MSDLHRDGSSARSFTVPQRVESSKSLHSEPSQNPLAASRQRRSQGSGAQNPLNTPSEGSVKRDDDARSARSGSSKSGKFRAIKADLSVELEHQVYFPGHIVRGTVRLKVTKDTRFYALRLRLAGKEAMVIRKQRYATSILTKQRETFWKELYTLEGSSKTLATAIGMKEKYRDQYVQVNTNNREDFNATCPVLTLPPGEYTYPFEVQLPQGIAPTFEAIGEEEDYAAIIYYAKAYLDIPGGGQADLVARTFFRVISRIGKAQWKEDAKPVVHHQQHAIESAGCCGGSKGKVKVSVEVPRRLISVAEDVKIPFRVVINNMDGTEPINRVMVQLVNILTVHAGGEHEERRTIVAQHSEQKVIQPGYNDGVIGKLEVPEDPVPSLEGVLFDSDYFFIVEVDIPFANDPSTTTPITLVQRVEKDDDVERHPLGKKQHEMAVGLHEYLYECPTDREAELNRIPVADSLTVNLSGKLGLQMAMDDSTEKGNLDLKVPLINPSLASQKRPLPRWKLVPPLSYVSSSSADYGA